MKKPTYEYRHDGAVLLRSEVVEDVMSHLKPRIDEVIGKGGNKATPIEVMVALQGLAIQTMDGPVMKKMVEDEQRAFRKLKKR